MSRRKTRALYILWCLLWLACSAAAQVDPSIVGKLREGGLVLYMRHTSTDFNQNDAAMTSYEDCAHQRNLTDKGRAEALHVRADVARLGAALVGEIALVRAVLVAGHRRIVLAEVRRRVAHVEHQAAFSQFPDDGRIDLCCGAASEPEQAPKDVQGTSLAA